MDFFGKDPQSIREWKKEINSVHAVMGIFDDRITQSVRRGVLLGLNDAFGDKKK